VRAAALLTFLLLAGAATSASARPADVDCLVGAYTAGRDSLALVRTPDDPKSLRFVLASGQTGFLHPQADGALAAEVQGPAGPLAARLDAASCEAPTVRLTLGGRAETWTRQRLERRRVRFDSDGVSLAGQLIRPAGASGRLPVVVFTHGSEAYAAIDVNPVPLLLATKGIAAFVYDKRGTGDSRGQYTQDFVRLGEDGAHAMAEARRLTQGWSGRVGVFGASQGGWIAPYVARKAHAAFVVVGYGVVGTPLEQDIWQVDYELAHLPLDTTHQAQDEVHRVTAVTAQIAASDFRQHLQDLDTLRADYGGRPWFSRIEGQYTGELLRGEIDRARKESPQVPWNYDSLAVLNGVSAPQLWMMAQEDSIAVSAPSVRRLEKLQREGKPIDLAIFPDTDHGIRTFRYGPDGKRIYTGIAPGYIQMTADWVKGRLSKSYGRAKLEPAPAPRRAGGVL